MKAIALIGVALFAEVFLCSESPATTWCNNGVKCQCVDYCKDNGWSDFNRVGNAKAWLPAAEGKGYATGSIPRKGAILVLDSWGKNEAGHVAIVQDIVSSSQITVNHSNWSPSGVEDNTIYTRVAVKDVSSGSWTSVSFYGKGSYPVLGFIYPKGMTETEQVCDLTERKCDIRYYGSVGWFPPIDNCYRAAQWFVMSVRENEASYPIGSANVSACDQVPPACYPR